MVTPGMISQSLKPFKDNPSIKVVNLMSKMDTVAEFESPDEVKVVVDKKAMQSIFLESLFLQERRVLKMFQCSNRSVLSLSNVTFS